MILETQLAVTNFWTPTVPSSIGLSFAPRKWEETSSIMPAEERTAMSVQTKGQGSTEVIKIRLIKAELQVGLRFAQIAALDDYNHDLRRRALDEAQKYYVGVLCELKRVAIPSLEDELWIGQKLEELLQKLEPANLDQSR
jgi:hypothetical protein